jgi:hypothetical protein
MNIKGYAHFTKSPEIVTADKLFWLGFLYRNLDKVVTIITNIPKDLVCIVCGTESLHYTSRSTLAKHIRHHSRSTCDYWLDNYINKSPEELESILLGDIA